MSTLFGRIIRKWRVRSSAALQSPSLLSIAISGLILLVNIVSGMILARTLGREDRGELAAILLWPSVISTLGSLGMTDAITVAAARDSSRSASGVMGAAVFVATLQSVALVGVGLLLFPLIFSDYDSHIRRYAMYYLSFIPLSFFSTYALAILNGRQRFRKFQIMRLVLFAVITGSLILLRVLGHLRVETAVVAYVGAYSLYLIVACVLLIRATNCVPTFDWLEVSQLLNFGLRSHLGNASSFLNERLDQVMMSVILSPTQLGVYVIAVTLTSGTTQIGVALTSVAMPVLARENNKASILPAIRRFVGISFLSSLIISVPIFAFTSSLIEFFFGAEFVQAASVCRILLIAGIFLSMSRVLGATLRARGNPLSAATSEIISLIITAVGLAILLPTIGILGAGIASLCAYALSFTLNLRQVSKKLDIPIKAIIVPALGFIGIRRIDKRATAGVEEQRQESITNTIGRGIPETDMKRSAPSFFVLDSPYRSLVIATCLLLPAIVGIVVSRFTPEAALYGGLGILTVILARFIRRSLAMRETAAKVFKSHASEPNLVDNLVRIPRILYIIATGFICILSLRPTSSLTISDWLYLLSLAILVLFCMHTHAFLRPWLPSGLVLGTCLFAIGGYISSLDSLHALGSLAMLIRFLYLTTIWFGLGTIVLTKAEHVRLALGAWVISGALTGGAAITQLFLGNVIPGTTISTGRMTGFAQHVNDLGGTASLAFVASLFFFSGQGNRLAGWSAVVLAALSGLGLLLSGSLSGLLAAGIGWLIWGILGNWRRLFALSLVFCLVGFIAFAALQQESSSGVYSPADRISVATNNTVVQNCSICARTATYGEAWDEITNHPWIGAGLDPISSKTPSGFQVHNVFLAPWFEAGILGFVGMIMVISSGLATMVVGMRRATTRLEWEIFRTLLAVFGAFITFGMGQAILFQRYGWVFFALALALRSQQLRSSSIRDRFSGMSQQNHSRFRERPPVVQPVGAD